MKVKCVTAKDAVSLTVGKMYDVLDEDERSFFITNDDGIRMDYSKKRFERYIVCILDYGTDDHLTRDAWYQVLETTRLWVIVIDNKGQKFMAHRNRFQT